jgi:hypothetical protein
MYFYIAAKTLYAPGSSYCCEFGMRLVSFETAAEVSCVMAALQCKVLKVIRENSAFNQNDICQVPSMTRFYTSGSDMGAKEYSWCPSGTYRFTGAVEYRPMSAEPPENHLMSIIMNSTSYMFVDENESRNSRYICEEY